MEKLKKIKLYPEKPIEVTGSNPFENDLLGFKDSVIRLSQIVNNIETPFTLGVFGSWGSGKTSFMKMLETQIKKEGNVTFWFDAWQYENETSLTLPLLSKMATTFVSKKEDFKNVKKIATTVLLTGADIILKNISKGSSSLKDIKDNFELYENLYDTWVSEIDSLRKEFQELVKKIKNDKSSIVIFIDDLDRCLPENVVKLIENIKHFLSVEGCIFVLGVDKDILSKGIQARYGSQLISGDEYLEKIVSISFNLPQRQTSDNGFIIETFRKLTEPDFYEQNKNEMKSFSNIISTLGIDNPRKLRLLILRYLFFLSLDDYPKYIKELVIKLIIYKELFPGVYNQKKEKGNINYLPPHRRRGVDAPDNLLSAKEIEENSCKDFAEILINNKYNQLIRFTSATMTQLSVFDKSETDIRKMNFPDQNKVSIDDLLSRGYRKSHSEYFKLIDLIFSLS